MIEELERFKAANDAGDIFIIRCLQNIVRSRAESGLIRTQLLSEPFYVTASGQDVRQLDAQTFEILDTKEIVRKL